MAVGSGIALFALGAILAFGVTTEAPGMDLGVIGYILMIAGAVGTVLGLVMFGSRRRRESVREVRPTGDGGQVVHTQDVA